MSWTEAKVRKLKELWGKGSTASQIAEIIGDMSRNAVIGKAHRLKLESRTSSKKTEPRSEKTKVSLQENKTQKLLIVFQIFKNMDGG